MALAVRKFLADSVDRLRSSAAKTRDFINAGVDRVKNTPSSYYFGGQNPIAQNIRNFASTPVPQARGFVQSMNTLSKVNPIQVLGRSIANSAAQSGDAMAQRQDLINQRTKGLSLKQRIQSAPTQQENQLLSTGLSKGAETYGKINAPYNVAKQPLTYLTTGALGGGASKLGGSSFIEGAKNAITYSSAIQPLVNASNPYLAKLMPKGTGLVANRLAPSVANVLQGIGLDVSTGQKTTPLSIATDAVTGALGQKSQFDIPTKNYDDILKEGKALGINGVSPRVNNVHPEDLDVMRQFADTILRRGASKKELGELGVSAQRLAAHYFGGDWKYTDNKRLAKAFEWAIDLNMNIPREARGKLPKLGLTEDQGQSVISGINRSQLSGKQLNTPNAKLKPEVQQAVKQQNEILKTKVNALDYFRTPEKVLQKVGLGKQAVELRRSFDAYQKELPEQIDKITKWYERVGKSPDASQRIFQYLDGKPIKLEGEELAVANEMRASLKDWADRLGLPEDKRVTNYITHIFDNELSGKEFDPELEKIIAQNIPGSVYDPFLQKRYGIAGYKEDAFAALDAYVKRATRKANMDPALNSLKKASEGLPQQTWNYIKSYTDRINMRPTELDNLLDTMIKQSPVGYKLGQRPVANITRNIRNAVYRGTLGLNIGSALRNLTQGANTYAELGERWTAKGYLDTASSILKGSKELDDVGALGGSMVQDRNLSATKKVAERIDKGLFAVFELAERINRGAAYFGAKARALNAGKSEQEAIREGLDIARKTQFTFGSIDTPAALQGDINKLLTQFQSYNIKQAEFLFDKVQKKEIAGLVRYVAAWTLFIKAGSDVLGFDWKSPLPFANEVSNSEAPVAKTPPFQLAKGVVRAGIQGKDKYGNQLDGNALQRITGDQEVQNAAGAMTIPGFNQIKKTVEGIKAFNRGYSEAKSGNIRYPIEQSQSNQIKTGLFGQYATKEAREYFDAEKKPLSESQTEIYKSLPKSEANKYYDSVYQERQLNKTLKDLEDGKIDEKKAESLIKQAGASESTNTLLKSNNKALNEKLNAFTKKKVKNGLPVSQEELKSAYLGEYIEMPSESKYKKYEKNTKLYTASSSINKNKDLSNEQKSYLLDSIAKEIGITRPQLDYYEIANDNDNLKTQFVLDRLEKIPTDQFKKFLTVGRVEVNGKMVISNGVVDNLVDDGYLTESEGKALKKYKYDQSGKSVTKSKVSSGSKSAFITNSEILTAFNQAMKASYQVKPPESRARTLGDLYEKRRRSFKLK